MTLAALRSSRFFASDSARSAWITWGAVGLVMLGGLLRLYDLKAMEFKGDEQAALDLSIGFLEQPWSSPHPWPTHGMLSSNGVANAPLFTWIVVA